MRLVRGDPVRAGIGLLGGIALVVLAAISINANFGLPANVNLGWPPGFDYRLSATFDDANGLARGAGVTIAGASVGQVTDVQPSGRRALATMRIERGYAPLHKGTIARIRYSTLLAQKYVELSPAAGTETIPSGARIPSTSTVTPVDFDQFLSTLDPETRTRLQTLVQEAGGGVEGRQEAINALLDNLGNLAVESRPALGTLNAHSSDLGSITANLATTSHRLSLSRDSLGGFVQHAGEVNGTLAASDRDLSGLIYHLASTMTDFDSTLSGEEGNLNQTVTTFDPFLLQLNGTLGYVYPYLHNNLGSLKTGIDVLIPYIGSAISQQDANGNYLRQYLVADACYDSTVADRNQPPPGCGSPATAPGQGTAQGPAPVAPPAPAPAPRKSPCPLASPPVKPPPPPTPVPTLTPCPTPLPPCVPLPGVPTPTPLPTASPGSCIPVAGNPLNPPGSVPVLPAPLPSLPGILTGLVSGGL